ncbi:unnamed protein product [Acanthosepion pharaonis]|uniref:Uncharacterized protein n=1 Tax=Acanthosepion pharaonis TaxID=158019 RepID=A0A812AKD9_ACAPH|nr:unnamed protein product [Sepia pharaonis]
MIADLINFCYSHHMWAEGNQIVSVLLKNKLEFDLKDHLDSIPYNTALLALDICLHSVEPQKALSLLEGLGWFCQLPPLQFLNSLHLKQWLKKILKVLIEQLSNSNKLPNGCRVFSLFVSISQGARRSRPKGRVPPILPPDTHGPLCDPTTAPASNFDPGDAPSAPLSPSTKPFLLTMAWVFIEPALSRANFSKTGVRRLAQSLLPSPVVVFGVGKGVSRPLLPTHPFPYLRWASSPTPGSRYLGLLPFLWPRDADRPSQRHLEVLLGMVVLEPPRLAHRCGFLSVVHFPLSRPLRSLRPPLRLVVPRCPVIPPSSTNPSDVSDPWLLMSLVNQWKQTENKNNSGEFQQQIEEKGKTEKCPTCLSVRRQVTWEQDWSCLSAFSCLRVPSVCDSERVCVSVELSSASHFMGPSKRAGVGMVSLWIASIPQRPIRRLPTTVRMWGEASFFPRTLLALRLSEPLDQINLLVTIPLVSDEAHTGL